MAAIVVITRATRNQFDFTLSSRPGCSGQYLSCLSRERPPLGIRRARSLTYHLTRAARCPTGEVESAHRKALAPSLGVPNLGTSTVDVPELPES